MVDRPAGSDGPEDRRPCGLDDRPFGLDDADLPDPCAVAVVALQARVADILRPAGALARLDELAVWLAGWQRTPTPTVDRPAALIFAGDHGVALEGVSAYPPEVTGAMLEAFGRNRASISAMAAVAGASVTAIDVGVGRPTGDIRVEPAMDHDRFGECFRTGRDAVRELITGPGVDLLIVGEMGIGNTTAAAAVCGALLGRPAADVVGAGTGIDGDTMSRKRTAVDEAILRARAAGAGGGRPLEALRHLGGTELVAMAGAMYEARRSSLPLLLDGYVTSASALALHRTDPRITANLMAGHASAEPGHRLVLDVLGLEPLLDLGFRLGEASGAMAAVPMVRMACALVNDVPTFAEWFDRSEG